MADTQEEPETCSVCSEPIEGESHFSAMLFWKVGLEIVGTCSAECTEDVFRQCLDYLEEIERRDNGDATLDMGADR